MLYSISDLTVCFSFSGSADLLYVEPKDSDHACNLTFHFLELLPVIIIQDTHIGDGGSVAAIFSSSSSTSLAGRGKMAATERPIPYVCRA